MMKTGKTFLVLSASLLCAQSAFAFSHGPQLSLEHFVSSPKTLWVGLSQDAPNLKSALGQFEIGEAKKLVVTTEANSKFQKIEWKPGQVVTFLESFSKLGPQCHNIVKSGSLWKGVCVVSSQDYLELQKNPYNYLIPVSLKEVVTLQPSMEVREAQSQSLSRFEASMALDVDEASLLKHVKVLSGVESFKNGDTNSTINERGGSANRKLTQTYMLSYYRSLGLEAKTVCYTQVFYSGCNVEATRWGDDRSKVFLVTSHLDSVNNAGADDNGTGTAAVMEIARVLSNIPLSVSVRFVSFDQEELGLIGSEAYAKQFGNANPKIAGVVNMDMLGYDSNNDGAFHYMDCSRSDSAFLSAKMTEVVNELDLGLRRVASCTNRSDHGSFWKRNIPAIVISENFFGGDDNKCYHKSCDRVDLVNTSYFVKISKVLLNTVYALAK